MMRYTLGWLAVRRLRATCWYCSRRGWVWTFSPKRYPGAMRECRKDEPCFARGRAKWDAMQF